MKIIFMIGSSRFKKIFEMLGRQLELAGHLPICMTFFAHSDKIETTESDEAILRVLDRARVDLANEIIVINGLWPRCTECKKWYGLMYERQCNCEWMAEDIPYIGEATRLEIEYALSKGKPVSYWKTP